MDFIEMVEYERENDRQVFLNVQKLKAKRWECNPSSPTKGTCEDCGDKIDGKRINVLPLARYCVDCQESREKNDQFEVIDRSDELNPVTYQMYLNSALRMANESQGY